jgi:D-alanine-D-alanine ligase
MSKRRKLRVLALVHEDLIPPDSLEGLKDEEVEPLKTEYDVVFGLECLGHDVKVLGLHDELAPLRETVNEWKPHIVWNLLEEFREQAIYDQNVVSYLELMGVPYTGCSPRGLIITRDKALSKKILHYHRIRVPGFAVVRRGRRVGKPRHLEYPLIVKSLVEEASLGISQASVVTNDERLDERVRFIHNNVQTDAIVEEYIDGRELYAPLLGNDRLTVLPIWELKLGELPEGAPKIATRKIKWDADYQEKYKINIGRARGLSDEARARIERTAKRIYRVLGMSGYGRLDFRLTDDGRLYFLEANPNCDIATDAEFASSAHAAGLKYEALLQRILNLGLQRARAVS